MEPSSSSLIISAPGERDILGLVVKGGSIVDTTNSNVLAAAAVFVEDSGDGEKNGGKEEQEGGKPESHRPSSTRQSLNGEEEERMGFDMIRMIQRDEEDEEERERASSANALRGPNSLLSLLGGGNVARSGRSRTTFLHSDDEGESQIEDKHHLDDETDEGYDVGMEWLRSLMIRLMLHSASTGEAFEPSLETDLRFFVGPELYDEIVEHAESITTSIATGAATAGGGEEEGSVSANDEGSVQPPPRPSRRESSTSSSNLSKNAWPFEGQGTGGGPPLGAGFAATNLLRGSSFFRRRSSSGGEEGEDLSPKLIAALAGLQVSRNRSQDKEKGGLAAAINAQLGGSSLKEGQQVEIKTTGGPASSKRCDAIDDEEEEGGDEIVLQRERSGSTGGAGRGKEVDDDDDDEEEEEEEEEAATDLSSFGIGSPSALPEDEDEGEEEEEGKEGEGEVDEWEDDHDPGYVVFTISEQQFFDLEEEAMEAAQRALLAAKMGQEVRTWNSRKGRTEEEAKGGKDVDRLRSGVKMEKMAKPVVLENVSPLPTSSLGGGSIDLQGDLPEAEAMLKAQGPAPSSPLPIGDPRASLLSVASTDLSGLSVGPETSSQAAVDAPVWPRQADDFAFSQAGDDEELVDPEPSLMSRNQGGLEGEIGSPLGGGREGEGDHLLSSSAEEEIDDFIQGGKFGLASGACSMHRKKVGSKVNGERKNGGDDEDEEGEEDSLMMEEMEGEEGVESGQRDKKESEAAPKELASFNLKVIYEPGRTGFEDNKDLTPPVGSIIAGRYKVQDYLGTAVFSTAIECIDLTPPQPSSNGGEETYVCLKIIKNNKDFFDQSLDEIKLLHYLKSSGDPDQCHFLRMHDYFYFKEHLIIVSELLKDNLYEFGKYLRETDQPSYFTLDRLRLIMKQCLEALAFIHSLGLIHCDIKPENIVIKSYSRVEIKIIDFGSSCFLTDHLTSYIQSRSYRAPEVILGARYGQKIDVWSLGCVLAELFSGYVLFQNDSIQAMLARMIGILGSIPEDLLLFGKEVPKYFTSSYIIFERQESQSKGGRTGSDNVMLLYPKNTSLARRVRTDDPLFLEFLTQLLQIHPDRRPTAEVALGYEWLEVPVRGEEEEGEGVYDDYEEEEEEEQDLGEEGEVEEMEDSQLLMMPPPSSHFMEEEEGIGDID